MGPHPLDNSAQVSGNSEAGLGRPLPPVDPAFCCFAAFPGAASHLAPQQTRGQNGSDAGRSYRPRVAATKSATIWKKRPIRRNADSELLRHEGPNTCQVSRGTVSSNISLNAATSSSESQKCTCFVFCPAGQIAARPLEVTVVLGFKVTSNPYNIESCASNRPASYSHGTGCR